MASEVVLGKPRLKAGGHCHLESLPEIRRTCADGQGWREVIGAGRPLDVLTVDVLERTYGARMDVLEHGGMPVVVDPFGRPAVLGPVRAGRQAG